MKADARMNDLKIVVLSGLHLGASISVSNRTNTVVGRDIGCDVMLRDDGIADRHMMLVVLDGKMNIVQLDGEVEVSGVVLGAGRSMTLQNESKCRLGQVWIGIGSAKVDWSTHDVVERLSLIRKKWISIRCWLTIDHQRRKRTRMIVLLACVLLMGLPTIPPVLKWWGDSRPEQKTVEQMMRHLNVAVASVDAREIEISFDMQTEKISVEGYVESDVALRRLETAIRETHANPSLRLFSAERILLDAREFILRRVKDADVSLASLNSIKVSVRRVLSPQVTSWLTQSTRSEVPGLKRVVIDVPEKNVLSRISPAPYSIISMYDSHILVNSNGERFFPGARLSAQKTLRAVSSETIVVEDVEDS